MDSICTKEKVYFAFILHSKAVYTRLNLKSFSLSFEGTAHPVSLMRQLYPWWSAKLGGWNLPGWYRSFNWGNVPFFLWQFVSFHFSLCHNIPIRCWICQIVFKYNFHFVCVGGVGWRETGDRIYGHWAPFCILRQGFRKLSRLTWNLKFSCLSHLSS